jgi:hypothetical protein
VAGFSRVGGIRLGILFGYSLRIHREAGPAGQIAGGDPVANLTGRAL